MCFRPADVDQIEHRCPECGTNNLPEATMCARCFAPMEPLTEADILAQKQQRRAQDGSAAISAAPSAPKPPVPSAPSNPGVSFGGFGDDGNDDGAVYF